MSSRRGVELVGGVPMGGNTGKDGEYFVPFYLGAAEEQHFTAQLDTGSSDLGLPSSGCKGCEKHADPWYSPSSTGAEKVMCKDVEPKGLTCTSCKDGQCGMEVSYADDSGFKVCVCCCRDCLVWSPPSLCSPLPTSPHLFSRHTSSPPHPVSLPPHPIPPPPHRRPTSPREPCGTTRSPFALDLPTFPRRARWWRRSTSRMPRASSLTLLTASSALPTPSRAPLAGSRHGMRWSQRARALSVMVSDWIRPLLAHTAPGPAAPCPATPCPATPCPATPCPATPCPATPCPATPC